MAREREGEREASLHSLALAAENHMQPPTVHIHRPQSSTYRCTYIVYIQCTCIIYIRTYMYIRTCECMYVRIIHVNIHCTNIRF